MDVTNSPEGISNGVKPHTTNQKSKIKNQKSKIKNYHYPSPIINYGDKPLRNQSLEI